MSDISGQVYNTSIPENDKAQIKNLLNSMYVNHFYDNKEVIRHMKNIENKSSLNTFDLILTNIFEFKVPYQSVGNEHFYYFIAKDSGLVSSLGYHSMMSGVLDVLEAVIESLYDMVITKGDETNYKKIDKVKFFQELPTSGGDALPITQLSNNIQYTHDSSNKKISIKRGNINSEYNVEYDRFINQFKPASEILKEDIINNYIYFFTSFRSNIPTQIYASYFYIKLAQKCFEFYVNLERMIVNGTQETDNQKKTAYLCTNYFKSSGSLYSFEMIALKGQINEIIKKTINNLSFPSGEAKVINLCPVKFEFTTSNIILANNIFTRIKNDKNILINNYAVTLQNSADKYSIKDFEYTDFITTSNYIKNVTLKAYAGECTKKESDYQEITLTQDENKMISFVKNSVDTLRKDYTEIGNKLQDINQSIDKAKDKINSQVKEYDAQKSILDALDKREYVYYAIFGVIGVVLLILLLVNTQQSIKMYSSVVILLILLSLNIINYYLKYDYIESFSNLNRLIESFANQSLNCSYSSDAAIPVTTTMIQPYVPIFTKSIIEVLQQLQQLLSSLNTEDFLTDISVSLKNEYRSFQGHDKIYNTKADINKKSIDIMKHEMVKKTAYLNLITIMSFIIVLIYVLYVLDPTYLNLYFVIGVILILINLGVYYLMILHPVRMKSRNKYWYKPSKNTLQQMN